MKVTFYDNEWAYKAKAEAQRIFNSEFIQECEEANMRELSGNAFDQKKVDEYNTYIFPIQEKYCITFGYLIFLDMNLYLSLPSSKVIDNREELNALIDKIKVYRDAFNAENGNPARVQLKIYKKLTRLIDIINGADAIYWDSL